LNAARDLAARLDAQLRQTEDEADPDEDAERGDPL
jgi:hypothetical protein